MYVKMYVVCSCLGCYFEQIGDFNEIIILSFLASVQFPKSIDVVHYNTVMTGHYKI